MALDYSVVKVDSFTVDDGHVVDGSWRVYPPSVYPPGFNASICGVSICGTPVALGTPSGQFGAVHATFLRVVGGVSSGQLFGTPKFQLRAPPGGVPSAQVFGVPTAVKLSSPQTRAVGAVASAAAFGTPTIKATIRPGAGGVSSAQAFGAVTAVALAAPQTKAVIGLGSAQSFGALTIKAAITRAVGAVPTAQAFGAPTTRLTQKPGGVPSAQQFGVPRTRVTVTVAGIGSAQAFGSIDATTKQRVVVPGVQGSSAHADSIVDQFTVDDGHVVNAESSSSYFGTPWVGHLWLLEADCIDFLEPAICGATCGLTICGGTNFIDDVSCLDGFLAPTRAESIVDEFIVDDGHVVDGELNGCLESPLPAICGPAICGTVVCGGASYISGLDCLDAELLITVTRTIDLQPAGCL